MQKFMLVQTLRFRMEEENQVKEEEERQNTTEDGGGGDGGEWFDLNELSALLCELDAVATQVGSQPAFHIQFLFLDHKSHYSVLQFGPWVVIQHAQFDLSHESGPYHSTQILLNADSKEFIIRVWGREAYTYNVHTVKFMRTTCTS